jgi:hypothetical protein
MRTLLATMVLLAGLSALNSTTDAAAPSRECQQAQNEDPAGQFAGYPCWAQESFGRGAGSSSGGG